ncbi:hypothetical protein [Chitinimonas sp.]|uniref:hypothetical protein n=1 Tax=Chitinimonas sp. TaxID=1934313 RepID=UPI002F94DF8A
MPCKLLSQADQAEIVNYLRRQVDAGTRPSQLFRCVRYDYPGLRPWQFGELLAAAYAPYGQDFPFFTISWQDRPSCPAWDRHYDLQVIAVLLRTGQVKAWTSDFCSQEWKKLQPLLAEEVAAQHARELADLHQDRLLARVAQLPGQPVCVQVAWLGDANGWSLKLSIYMQLDGDPEEFELATVATGAYLQFALYPDKRAKPCGEAGLLSQVAAGLAKTLGLPYHFASPNRPDDTALTWLETLHVLRGNPAPRRGYQGPLP